MVLAVRSVVGRGLGARRPPVLRNWQSLVGLSIEGEAGDPYNGYFIRGHVDGIQRCDPITAVVPGSWQQVKMLYRD
jgi:hypothetical protein